MECKALRENAEASKIENSQLRQVINFYENRNEKGLKQLTSENLQQLEENLTHLMEALRREKFTRELMAQLSQAEGSNESAALIKNLRDLPCTNEHTPSNKICFPSEFYNAGLSFNESIISPNPIQVIEYHSNSKPVDLTAGSPRNVSFKYGVSPLLKHCESFDTYYSAIHAADQKEFLQSEQHENIDRQLNSLKSSFKKLTEQMGMPDGTSNVAGLSVGNSVPLHEKSMNGSGNEKKSSPVVAFSLQDVNKKPVRNLKSPQSIPNLDKTLNNSRDVLAADNDENTGSKPGNVLLLRKASVQGVQLNSNKSSPMYKTTRSRTLAGLKLYI